jgi:hypothetical protein
MYVLITIAFMSYHGASGIATTMQEFTTKERCEKARRVFLDLQDHKQVRAECVEK